MAFIMGIKKARSSLDLSPPAFPHSSFIKHLQRCLSEALLSLMDLIITVNSSSSRKKMKLSSQIAPKHPRGLSVLCAKAGTGAYLYYRYTNAKTDECFRFCREILGPNVDPVERLQTIRPRDIRVHMRWLLATSNIQRLGAMESRMKVWLIMYRDEVGHPLNVNMRFQINTIPSLQVFINYNNYCCLSNLFSIYKRFFLCTIAIYIMPILVFSSRLKTTPPRRLLYMLLLAWRAWLSS